MKPAKHQFTLLQQVMSNIPAYLVPSVARAYGVDKRSRTFTPWSHVVAMVYAQLNHALSLNDVCDALRIHSGAPQQLYLPLFERRPVGQQGDWRRSLTNKCANSVKSSYNKKRPFWNIMGGLGPSGLCLWDGSDLIFNF